MNCHIRARPVLMTWHTAWNGKGGWGRGRQHEDMHTNWSSGLLLFLHTGVWENSIIYEKTRIIYAFPWGKSRFFATSDQMDRTQRDMSLTMLENSISSTGYELTQSKKKNPMCLFEATHTLHFVEFHTEVFRRYGNRFLNAWTEWSAQTTAVTKQKQQHRILTQKFLQKCKLLTPSIAHTFPSQSPKRLSTLRTPIINVVYQCFNSVVLAIRPLRWRLKKIYHSEIFTKKKGRKTKLEANVLPWLPFPLLGLISSVTPSTGSHACKLTLYKLISESTTELSEKLPPFYISASLYAFICQWWNKQSLTAWPPALTLSPKH